jgi:hypothetical protein
MRFRRRSRVAEEAPRAGEAPRAAEAPREPEAPTAGPGGPVSRAQLGERPARRGIMWRTRDAGAAAVGAAGAGVVMLARLVMAVATLIALLIALAIVLRDVDANPANTIVKGIHEGANFFAGAFTDLITFKGHPKRAITINWGIALLAYLIVGGFIARVIRRIGHGGLRFERTRRSTAPTHY